MSSSNTSNDTVTGVVSALAGEGQDPWLELKLPGTDYRLKLVPPQGFAAEVGDKLEGRIEGKARRMDVIPAGGRYVEPVAGRPRRVQGRIVGGDVSANTLAVKAGPVLHVTPTDPRQKASDFMIGQMVSFDVEPGATFG